MKLAGISNGPDWVIWIGFAIFAVLSLVLILGKGSFLIAGYNTASKEEKAKYDERKLCRAVGIGMAIISVLILVTGLFENILPASFAYIAFGIIVIDCVGIGIVGKKFCKKR